MSQEPSESCRRSHDNQGELLLTLPRPPQLCSAAVSQSSGPESSLDDDAIKGDVPPPPPPLHATVVEGHLDQQVLRPVTSAVSAAPAPHMSCEEMADLAGGGEREREVYLGGGGGGGNDASAIVISGGEANWLGREGGREGGSWLGGTPRSLTAPPTDVSAVTAEPPGANMLVFAAGGGGKIILKKGKINNKLL